MWIDHYETTEEIKKVINRTMVEFVGFTICPALIEDMKNTLYKRLKEISERRSALDIREIDFDIHIDKTERTVAIVPNNAYTRELMEFLRGEG